MARSDHEKNSYNNARRKALQDLARRHPREYQELVEARLGRPLQERGRVLSERIKTGESRYDAE